LIRESGKPAAVLARELGVPRNRLYKWATDVEKQGATAFGGSGNRPSDEVAKLRREVARLKKENEILKKAAAYFAKELPRLDDDSDGNALGASAVSCAEYLAERLVRLAEPRTQRKNRGQSTLFGVGLTPAKLYSDPCFAKERRQLNLTSYHRPLFLSVLFRCVRLAALPGRMFDQ
jgi:transposase